jgi:hypothetical protein
MALKEVYTMSFIPNVRSKAQIPLYSGTRGGKVVGENNYYEGYLSDDDAAYVSGFDWNTEMCVSNYFDNVDIYESEFHDILEALGVDAKEAFNHILSIDKDGSELTVDDIKNMPDLDKVELLFSIFRKTILQHIESERDELVVTMLDAYSDEEFDTNKKAYINGHRNQVIIQNNKCFEFADADGNYYDEEVYDTKHTEMFPLIDQDYEDDLNGYVVIGEDDDDTDEEDDKLRYMLALRGLEDEGVVLGSEPTDDMSLLTEANDDSDSYEFDDYANRYDDEESVICGESDCLADFKKNCASIINQLYVDSADCDGCILSDGCNRINCPLKDDSDDE